MFNDTSPPPFELATCRLKDKHNITVLVPTKPLSASGKSQFDDSPLCHSMSFHNINWSGNNRQLPAQRSEKVEDAQGQPLGSRQSLERTLLGYCLAVKGIVKISDIVAVLSLLEMT